MFLNKPLSKEFYYRSLPHVQDEIRRRTLFRAILYPIFYLAATLVTSIAARAPKEALFFGLSIGLASLVRLMLAVTGKLQLKWGTSDRIFDACLLWLAISWGALAAFTICRFELGWISFFVILTTYGLVSNELAVLSLRIRLWVAYLVCMLLPAALASSLVVPGLSGLAMSILFLTYFVFTLAQGWVHFGEYWLKLRENSQLKTMIEAVPGPLGWVSSDLKILGTNRKMGEILGPQGGIVFKESHDLILRFASQLFRATQPFLSSELDVPVRGAQRKFYFFGQRYSQDTEAVLLGLDMTERYETERSVLTERAQRLFSARMTGLGQFTGYIVSILIELLKNPEKGQGQTQDAHPIEEAKKVLSIINSVYLLPKASSGQSVFSLIDLLTQVRTVFQPQARLKGVELKTFLDLKNDDGPWISIRGSMEAYLEAIFHLMSNAFDAVEEVSSKEVLLTIRHNADREVVQLEIEDSGPGVAAIIKNRMFEPLLTTKSGNRGSGVGLSVAREIIEQNGGTLYYDGTSQRTRFVVELQIAGRKNPDLV